MHTLYRLKGHPGHTTNANVVSTEAVSSILNSISEKDAVKRKMQLKLGRIEKVEVEIVPE
jgi:hypothetical protein